MLEEMDSFQLQEWIAMDRIEEEWRKRSELATRAETGVENFRRKGR